MNGCQELVITRSGGPEVLALREVERPVPGRGELLVEVAGAGLNRADLLQRAGHYPAPPGSPSDVPGLEFAGTVSRLGSPSAADGGEAAWRVGDAVMGLVGGGAMASHLVVSADEVLPVPDGVDLVAAAGWPEAALTAFDALVLQGELRAAELVLVHAAGSGVGTAALQLVRALGATCVGTSRSAWKLRRCVELGLQHAVLIDSPDALVDAVLGATDGRRPELVLQTIGAAYLPGDLELLAPRGRLLQVGLLGGRHATIDLGALVAKRLVLRGSVLRSRPAEERRALIRAARDRLLPLLASGAVRPIIDDTLPLSEAASAHQRLADNKVFGKLVLTPRST